ncbi:MAG: HD domain-containing protein [Clostridiales bacterium]|nr:HD domain-containing protein [Clostridiales bacterium]
MIKRKLNVRKHIRNVLGIFLVFCILFSFQVPLLAGADGGDVIDPTVDKEKYAAFLYDNTNGLPTAEANAIAETSDGFIWIGSYGGLIRYDGNVFERYPSTSGIASVVSLFVDSRDMLWIGTNDNGAALMDRYGHVTMFGKQDGLPSASVRSFAEDLDGNIYVATTQGITIIDPDNNMSPVDTSMLEDPYVRRLEAGPDGDVYGLSMDGEIFTLSDGKITRCYSSEELGIDEIHAIHADPDNPGMLYLGTKGSQIFHGSFDKRFEDKTLMYVAPYEYINAIMSVGDNLWICSNNGVCVYKNGMPVPLENIPMKSNVECVMSDYQGNLWFVSSRQGVMKIVPDMFTDVFDEFDIVPGVVNSTCCLDDMVFIAKDSGLVVTDKTGVVSRINLTSAVTSSGKDLGYLELISMFGGVRIRSIIKDSKDRLWFSSFDKKLALVRYDHGNVVVFSPEDGLPSERVRTVYERKNGSFLVACTGGVVVIRDDKIEKVYDAGSGMSNTEVLIVCENTNGDIIAGTDGGGLCVINGLGAVMLDTSNGLMSDVVMRIKKDESRSVFWIVTSNSLAYMTFDYEIHTITNFPYSNNFDMYENSKGDLWVLSSNGVYVCKADELLTGNDIDPVFYGIANGVSVISTSNSYSGIDKNGYLYIAGTTGVVKVNIEEQFETVNNIKMTVPYVDVDGIKIYPDENGVITVPRDAKKVTVYPRVCTYTLMDPMVTYYLEGFDREKNVAKRSDFTSIDYTNLKGGKYTFKMSISDAMGYGINEYSIAINKTRAPYEMLWFLVLVGILLVCGSAVIVYAYTNKKTQALLKKQEEDRTLIREIVEAFAKTIDMKDRYTKGHSTRVARYTAMLAKEMGYNEETVEKYRNIALLHDIGKIGVRGEVLNKNGRLEDNEFDEIKSHTIKGYNVLKDISIMPELSIGAESHHERPDGKGYPQGLKGDEIPMVAQIIAVADTFDAMYSDRPYRKRMNFDKVVSIIKGVAGTQLSEEVVEAFLRIVERGGFRAKNDKGGGSTEDIDNIHKRLNKEAEEAEDHSHQAE